METRPSGITRTLLTELIAGIANFFHGGNASTSALRPAGRRAAGVASKRARPARQGMASTTFMSNLDSSSGGSWRFCVGCQPPNGHLRASLLLLSNILVSPVGTVSWCRAQPTPSSQDTTKGARSCRRYVGLPDDAEDGAATPAPAPAVGTGKPGGSSGPKTGGDLCTAGGGAGGVSGVIGLITSPGGNHPASTAAAGENNCATTSTAAAGEPGPSPPLPSAASAAST
mmetsp:Transcript_174097/g.558198  ORF Transcript_174097/g.558198 Transcript_174097/m.558198 type:complete len:228 (-) Transcript_174097:5005-5688(-)